MNPITSWGSAVLTLQVRSKGQRLLGRSFLYSATGWISMIPFHSKTPRAMENLQKFWAEGDVIFFLIECYIRKICESFWKWKSFQHSMKELEASWDIYYKTRMANYYPKWNLIGQRQHKKTVLTIFIAAINASKMRTFFMRTNIFNDKQIKAAA